MFKKDKAGNSILPKGKERLYRTIDIDGDKTNNKINNLRLASFEQNAANRHVVKSKTGYRGVYESKYKGEVVGYIAQYNKKHLGFFKEVKEAAKAVDKYMFEKLGSFVKPNIGGDLDD